jgi:hypothetical protein
MSNGARHGLGFLVGLVAAPALFVWLAYAVKEQTALARDPGTANARYAASTLAVALAVVVALLVASRLSPMASLVPGVVFVALSAPHAISLTYRADDSFVNALPDDLRPVMAVHTGPGVLLLILGALLLAASAFPARWRPQVEQADQHSSAHTATDPQTPAGLGPSTLQFGSPGPSAAPEHSPFFGGPDQPHDPTEERERPSWAGTPGGSPRRSGPPPLNAP